MAASARWKAEDIKKKADQARSRAAQHVAVQKDEMESAARKAEKEKAGEDKRHAKRKAEGEAGKKQAHELVAREKAENGVFVHKQADVDAAKKETDDGTEESSRMTSAVLGQTDAKQQKAAGMCDEPQWLEMWEAEHAKPAGKNKAETNGTRDEPTTGTTAAQLDAQLDALATLGAKAVASQPPSSPTLEELEERALLEAEAMKMQPLPSPSLRPDKASPAKAQANGIGDGPTPGKTAAQLSATLEQPVGLADGGDQKLGSSQRSVIRAVSANTAGPVMLSEEILMHMQQHAGLMGKTVQELMLTLKPEGKGKVARQEVTRCFNLISLMRSQRERVMLEFFTALDPNATGMIDLNDLHKSYYKSYYNRSDAPKATELGTPTKADARRAAKVTSPSSAGPSPRTPKATATASALEQRRIVAEMKHLDKNRAAWEKKKLEEREQAVFEGSLRKYVVAENQRYSCQPSAEVLRRFL